MANFLTIRTIITADEPRFGVRIASFNAYSGEGLDGWYGGMEGFRRGPRGITPEFGNAPWRIPCAVCMCALKRPEAVPGDGVVSFCTHHGQQPSHNHTAFPLDSAL